MFDTYIHLSYVSTTRGYMQVTVVIKWIIVILNLNKLQASILYIYFIYIYIYIYK